MMGQMEKSNSLVKVDSDTVVLAYGGNSEGRIKTFDITADGDINTTEKDELQHDNTAETQGNSLIEVATGVYALAYASTDDDGIVKTFTIDADGTNITQEASNGHANKAKGNSLVKLDTTKYALAYEGDADGEDDGYITSFTITADGTSITECTCQLEHDTGTGKVNSLLKVDSDTVVLAYQGTDDDGFITTFTIPAVGATTITEVQTLEHDAADGKGNSLVEVATGVYALAYEGAKDDGGGDNGVLKTITISVESSPTSTSETSSAVGGSSAKKFKTRPTFGLDHNTFLPLIEGGFAFNGVSHDITNNYWTPFAQQKIKLGEMNSFSTKVLAQEKLRVQEFLFGIPDVGYADKAELGVEVFYDYDGEIEKVRVIQKTDVIDIDSLQIATAKSKCLSSSIDEKCVTTLLSMKFLEPLKDNVMALKATDYKGRFQFVYLNEGFDISGNSLNPMLTKMVPGTGQHEGLIEITQTAKYSDTWVANDGREFQLNEYDSVTQINQSFERHIDTNTLNNRNHSEFYRVIEYEIKTAQSLIDKIYGPYSDEKFTEINDIFSYTFPETIPKALDPQIQATKLSENLKAKQLMDKMYPYMASYGKALSTVSKVVVTYEEEKDTALSIIESLPQNEDKVEPAKVAVEVALETAKGAVEEAIETLQEAVETLKQAVEEAEEESKKEKDEKELKEKFEKDEKELKEKYEKDEKELKG